MHFELRPGLMPDEYGEGILPLAAAKAHLRVLHDDEDDLIAALRDAAIDLIEQMTALYLARRSDIEQVFAGFGPRMVLGMGPAIAVVAVKYDASAGESDLAVTDWRVGPHGRLLPGTGAGGGWPGDCIGNVTVTYDAGYTDIGKERPQLLAAVRLMLGHLYEKREAVGGATAVVPFGVMTIINAVRMPVI